MSILDDLIKEEAQRQIEENNRTRIEKKAVQRARPKTIQRNVSIWRTFLYWARFALKCLIFPLRAIYLFFFSLAALGYYAIVIFESIPLIVAGCVVFLVGMYIIQTLLGINGY